MHSTAQQKPQLPAIIEEKPFHVTPDDQMTSQSLSARCLGVFCIATLACGIAQAQPKTEPIPEPAPPPPTVAAGADDGIEPEVTIHNRGGDRYEEYRVNGQLYMIKITPRIGKPYYLVARDRNKGFERLNELDSGYSIPQWVLLRW